MVKQQLKKALVDALLKTGVKADEVELLRPTEDKFGDYSTNVALRLRSGSSTPDPKNKQSPMEFAKKLADSLQNLPHIKKLEVKAPGFINFWIKEEILQKEVEELLGKKVFKSKFSNKKVIVEFTDPNPFKEFHIGHLYSNSVGEAISRLFESVGANVKRANYQGDVGLHVAKCIWGMRRQIKNSNLKVKSLSQLGAQSLNERIKFLGEAYAIGAKAFEEDSKAKEEITELNQEIYEKGDQIEEYKLGKKWSLDHFEEIYQRLGTKFDLYYLESEVGQYGAKLVREYLGSVFEESEGAIIFPGEKYGLHNRVFISSLGLPTYEAKELGLAPKKFEDFEYDVSVIVTGNEINDYFKVLLAALAQIAPNLAEKTKHIGHGMVRMPGGKISSRLGNVLSGEWLLNEAKKEAKALITGSSKGKTGLEYPFSKHLEVASELKMGKVRPKKEIEKDIDILSEQIGVGAVKYSLLKNNIGQDTQFSFEESISLEGNSGPYLQYTHARCRSVLERSKVKGQKSKLFWQDLTKEEDLLLRALGHFEEIVLSAAQNFSPNTVAVFLYELAQKYNLLYNNLPIIKAGKAQVGRRLFLTQSTADILNRGLNLLGISASDKM